MNSDILDKAVRLRHQLHTHPELSGEEKETKAALMAYLRENTGLEVEDRGLWFYAVYTPDRNIPAGADGPVPGRGASSPARGPIAFRADFDAIKVLEETPLPYASVNRGTAHKCGHDGHSAALAAFAEDVDRQGADRQIYFIFQHGEETGIGGRPCAELIEEKGIEEVYGVHNFPGAPFGSLGIRTGTINCASKGMEIIFTGASAHASQPEMGRNPAKAVSRTVLELDHIADPFRYSGLILATVVQIDVGERAFGVAAHRGSLLLTIRGQKEEELDAMQKEIESFAAARAEEDGLGVQFRFYDEFPETANHRESVEKLKRIAEQQGWPVNEMADPIRSSEDFGYYLKKAPGALIWLGAGEDWPPIHSEEFDYNDRLIARTAELFWALVRA